MNATRHPTEAAEADLSNLAAEYALGILQGADRRRFELLMAANPTLKTFVLKWGDLFNGLEPKPMLALPEPTDESVWDRIERRLDTEEKVMLRLHEQRLSVRTSLALSLGALRVMRERLTARRAQLAPVSVPVPVPSAAGAVQAADTAH